MTDNEIIKALECSPLNDIGGCRKIDALDLINRQKAEIEEFAKTIVMLDEQNKEIQTSFERVGKNFVADVKKIKSEARKEVVDVVRKELLAGFGEVVTADMLDRINTILAGMEGEGNV